MPTTYLKYALPLGLCFVLFACKPNPKAHENAHDALQNLLNHYWERRMQLFPLEATAKGDYRYNNKLTITIAESFRDSLKQFYTAYADAAKQIDTTGLNANDKLSLSVFSYEMGMSIEGLKYPSHLLPINQFWAFTLDLPQLGSAQGNQPFKTVKDYNDFLERLAIFPAYADTAIYNMQKGIKANWVLPRTLVLKIVPQLRAMLVKDAKESIFYGAIKLMPATFADSDKQRLTIAYTKAIEEIVIPTYRKLYDFFELNYLPNSRNSSGIGFMPGGKAYYDYCIKYWTTTDLSADSIYNLGLAEVARIEAEMDKAIQLTGAPYTDRKKFFCFINSDKQFYPFSSPREVIDSFWRIKKQEEPRLRKLFIDTPLTPFTIRQTEAFREASASAEYNQASEDGSRPGIFYVPIPDARKYNAFGMVSLFMHEAIPGHHYQISIQQENKNLPTFRRFLWYGAYGEGWALYSESLGKEIGMYNNPYQLFGHLSDAIHRAIRLVVDVGMHAKGMSREEAISYMMAHEAIDEAGAEAEIERYMAIPGQALSYKIGELTIRAERTYYEKKMGNAFSIARFHQLVLKEGCLPLQLLREQLKAMERK
jgi:uncharacterized protein (DUF885 family)